MADRLDAADAWFLYLENPTVHLHVLGVLLVDPSDRPDFSFEVVRRHVASRLDRLPVLRRRLVEVPLGIDHPEWIDDPDFDLDRHVRHHRVRGRGSRADLERYLGTLAGQQLPRDRPLWEMVYVDGLADGTVAIATKLHHCIVDGVTGVAIMADLLDTLPPEDWDDPAEPFAPASSESAGTVPSPVKAAAGAVLHRLATPTRPLRSALGVATSGARIAGAVAARRLRGQRQAARPLDAPRTMFNATLTARRSVAMATAPLDDVMEVRAAFGVTVNDVVLAAVTHGVRRYLAARGDLPDRPLVCSVPVSVHGKSRGGTTNQVSNMFVHLPVHLADPLDRLHAVRQASLDSKQVQGAVGGDMLADVVELIPPPVLSSASGAYSRARLADRLPPVHNLVVSNVRGSPVPLWFAGARLAGLFPFGPLMEGAALNISVLSHVDEVHVGIITCPDVAPRVRDLASAIIEGVTALRDLARREGGV